jgi:hypothetical protein
LASNAIRPEDWPDLVRRIRDASDAEVGAFLTERERRFDNYLESEYFEEWDPVWRDSAGTAVPTFAVRTGWIYRKGRFVEFAFLVSTADSMAGVTSGMYVELPTDLVSDVDATYGFPAGASHVQQSFPGDLDSGILRVVTANRIQHLGDNLTTNFSGGVTWRAHGSYRIRSSAVI